MIINKKFLGLLLVVVVLVLFIWVFFILKRQFTFKKVDKGYVDVKALSWVEKVDVTTKKWQRRVYRSKQWFNPVR